MQRICVLLRYPYGYQKLFCKLVGLYPLVFFILRPTCPSKQLNSNYCNLLLSYFRNTLSRFVVVTNKYQNYVHFLQPVKNGNTK